MKYLFFILVGLIAFSCQVNKVAETGTTASKKVDEINYSATDQNISPEDFYFRKYFDQMEEKTLQTGLILNMPIGDQDCYSILKATSKLSSSGNLEAESKLYNYLDTLETLVGPNNQLTMDYFTLFKLCDSLPIEKLFSIGMKYMAHYYPTDTQIFSGADVGNSLPAMDIFSVFRPFIENPEKDKYDNLILNGFRDPKNHKGDLTQFYIWSSVFPVIEADYKNKSIRLKEVKPKSEK